MYLCAIVHDIYILWYVPGVMVVMVEHDNLLLPMLYALVTGLVTLAFLLLCSSPDKPPKWHKALCAVGFVVAIGWISTIADEVVGVLRAFGAIVNVSEAILGVTVFAMAHPPNRSN